MDKETLSEYGNIIIVAIVACLILAALTSSFFTGKLVSLVEATTSEYEQYEYDNNAAFKEYIAENAVQ